MQAAAVLGCFPAALRSEQSSISSCHLQGTERSAPWTWPGRSWSARSIQHSHVTGPQAGVSARGSPVPSNGGSPTRNSRRSPAAVLGCFPAPLSVSSSRICVCIHWVTVRGCPDHVIGAGLTRNSGRHHRGTRVFSRDRPSRALVTRHQCRPGRRVFKGRPERDRPTRNSARPLALVLGCFPKAVRAFRALVLFQGLLQARLASQV
jgi:hypothetical protein